MSYIRIVLLASCSLFAASAAIAVERPLFSQLDKPVSQKTVNLPADPAYPGEKSILSCFYYPDFMIKEIDNGEVGAELLSIVPDANASCEKTSKKEFIEKDWSGYVGGAKGNYVFFTGEDGYNGGLPFAVYNAKDGKKLFDDTVDKSGFSSSDASAEALSLRYTRVFTADCSLAAQKANCWKNIKKTLNLSDIPAPDCMESYSKEQLRTPQQAQEVLKAPSVITYPVKAHYAAGKAVFRPLNGKPECRISD